MKITVGINSLTSSQWAAYTNHIQFFYNLGRRYQDIEFILVNPERMTIDRMRNMAAKVALDTQSDYLLFLDDDVVVPFDGLRKLIDVNADIVAANVIIRGYPFDYMFFKEENNSLVTFKELPQTTVFDVEAVGFSFCLIKTSVFGHIIPPFFVTGLTNTEDIYFCVKAKQAIRNLTIKVDSSVVCRHILWSEMISEENRRTYKKYMEEQFPGLEKAHQDMERDRGEDYLKMVKEQVNKAER
jgi:hypothetical protein